MDLVRYDIARSIGEPKAFSAVSQTDRWLCNLSVPQRGPAVAGSRESMVIRRFATRRSLILSEQS